jgi:hypothetical protein
LNRELAHFYSFCQCAPEEGNYLQRQQWGRRRSRAMGFVESQTLKAGPVAQGASGGFAGRNEMNPEDL